MLQAPQRRYYICYIPGEQAAGHYIVRGAKNPAPSLT